jgi:hypothetical protein
MQCTGTDSYDRQRNHVNRKIKINWIHLAGNPHHSIRGRTRRVAKKITLRRKDGVSEQQHRQGLDRPKQQKEDTSKHSRQETQIKKRTQMQPW